MRILLINGSPKGKTSNSLRLAESFVEGVREVAAVGEAVGARHLGAGVEIGLREGAHANAADADEVDFHFSERSALD